MNQTLPVPIETIQGAIVDARMALTPIDGKELAVRLFRALVVFRIPDNWEEQAPAYVEALADIPADLFPVAMARIVKGSRFFPTPAEIRATVSNEIAERWSTFARLQAMESKAKREEREDERRRQQAEARIQRWRDGPVSDDHSHILVDKKTWRQDDVSDHDVEERKRRLIDEAAKAGIVMDG